MKTLQSKKIGNMELHYDRNFAVINIDARIFPIEVIDVALNLMKEKADVKIGEIIKDKIELQLIPKQENESLENLGREFNNKLINCLASNMKENSTDNLETLEQSFLEDSLGISKLWSE